MQRIFLLILFLVSLFSCGIEEIGGDGDKAVTPADNGDDNFISFAAAVNNTVIFIGEAVIGGRLARTVTRNHTVVLFEIIGHFNRVILNCSIKICKSDDENEVENRIKPTGGAECFEEAFPEEVN